MNGTKCLSLERAVHLLNQRRLAGAVDGCSLVGEPLQLGTFHLPKGVVERGEHLGKVLHLAAEF